VRAEAARQGLKWSPKGSNMTPKTITLVLGIVYVAVGILGFVPGIVTANGLLLGIFAVNTLHNIAHLAAGAVLVWGGLNAANTTMANRVMAVVFAALFVASFIAPIVEQVPMNAADSILHLASAALCAYIGFVWGQRPMAAT
jgi:hypothetical protein